MSMSSTYPDLPGNHAAIATELSDFLRTEYPHGDGLFLLHEQDRAALPTLAGRLRKLLHRTVGPSD